MKNYKIVVNDSHEIVLDIKANTYYDARIEAYKMLEKKETLMDCVYYDREVYNALSNPLTENIEFGVKYDCNTGILYIQKDKILEKLGYCDNVSQLAYRLELYCKSEFEDYELTIDDLEDEICK